MKSNQNDKFNDAFDRVFGRPNDAGVRPQSTAETRRKNVASNVRKQRDDSNAKPAVICLPYSE